MGYSALKNWAKKCAYDVCTSKCQGEGQKVGKSTIIWGTFKLQYLKLETSFWKTFKGYNQLLDMDIWCVFKKVTWEWQKNEAKVPKFGAILNCNISDKKKDFDRLSKARIYYHTWKYEVCQNKQKEEGHKVGKSAKIWGTFKLQYIKLETSFWQTFKG